MPKLVRTTFNRVSSNTYAPTSLRRSHNKFGRLFPLRYIPRTLSKKDVRKQTRELLHSRKSYKKAKPQYYTRQHISSFHSKPSNHVSRARQIYKIESIVPSPELSRKTGCSVSALRQIMKKGEGAYYSSGSRPNQTAQSWGYARLASAITSGKSAAVDFSILEKGCKHNKPAYRMALQSRKKHGHGKRHTVRRAAF
jgi:hypothetical protein